MKFRNLRQKNVFATTSKQGIRLWFKNSDTTAVGLTVSYATPEGSHRDFPCGITRGRQRKFSPDHQIIRILSN